MTTDDESHILRTTTKRLVKGLVIIVGIMIVGTVIALSQWEHMHSVPPQSSKLKPEVDLSNPPGGVAASCCSRRVRLQLLNQKLMLL